MYIAIFEFLINLIPELKETVRYVACDYEAALISAVKTSFTSATLYGCLFHYQQVLYRNASSFSLVLPLSMIASDFVATRLTIVNVILGFNAVLERTTENS